MKPFVEKANGKTRRSFLTTSAVAVGATALAGIAGVSVPSFGQSSSTGVTADDIAVLSFLAAAELVEDDLWQQYCELAVGNEDFHEALTKIDPALVRYVCDDRDDERSHAELINAFLVSVGASPVNLDPFRTLPSVKVMGAQNRGRLTNLTALTVDTSWYARYRSKGNPDFGDTFPQIVKIVNRPTVPTTNGIGDHQALAIAQTAAFHFATIEQGGSSLYNSLLTKVTDLDVLAILGSIGPTEVYHFAVFHSVLENIRGINGNGVHFPDLQDNPELNQAIFPEPCKFLRNGLPLCSVIRPRSTEKAGAVAAATGLVNSGLFQGQPQAFFDAVVALATAADNATRHL